MPFNLVSIDGSTEDKPQEDIRPPALMYNDKDFHCLLWLFYIT